jgi:hypothetical protein
MNNNKIIIFCMSSILTLTSRDLHGAAAGEASSTAARAPITSPVVSAPIKTEAQSIKPTHAELTKEARERVTDAPETSKARGAAAAAGAPIAQPINTYKAVWDSNIAYLEHMKNTPSKALLAQEFYDRIRDESLYEDPSHAIKKIRELGLAMGEIVDQVSYLKSLFEARQHSTSDSASFENSRWINPSSRTYIRGKFKGATLTLASKFFDLLRNKSTEEAKELSSYFASTLSSQFILNDQSDKFIKTFRTLGSGNHDEASLEFVKQLILYMNTPLSVSGMPLSASAAAGGAAAR